MIDTIILYAYRGGCALEICYQWWDLHLQFASILELPELLEFRNEAVGCGRRVNDLNWLWQLHGQSRQLLLFLVNITSCLFFWVLYSVPGSLTLLLAQIPQSAVDVQMHDHESHIAKNHSTSPMVHVSPSVLAAHHGNHGHGSCQVLELLITIPIHGISDAMPGIPRSSVCSVTEIITPLHSRNFFYRSLADQLRHFYSRSQNPGPLVILIFLPKIMCANQKRENGRNQSLGPVLQLSETRERNELTDVCIICQDIFILTTLVGLHQAAYSAIHTKLYCHVEALWCLVMGFKQPSSPRQDKARHQSPAPCTRCLGFQLCGTGFNGASRHQFLQNYKTGRLWLNLESKPHEPPSKSQDWITRH